MTNYAGHGAVFQPEVLVELGLNATVIRDAIQYTHRILDLIDASLVEATNARLAHLIELANLSAIIGNLFRSGVANASGGAFKANRPHTYPDLLAVHPDALDIESKLRWRITTRKAISLNLGLT